MTEPNQRSTCGVCMMPAKMEPDMRIDFYTRVVLTTIALCLVWLCVVLTPMGTPVSAQPSVQNVRIVGIQAPAVIRDTAPDGSIRQRTAGDWDTLPTD